ncbi:MAG: prolipoprotein diacylglyceryl transferase [Deltaproteobacteria bacterium]|nr:prolipoprotein diacylglyceryl transferase [Deltaproteobacteria bacterium]
MHPVLFHLPFVGFPIHTYGVMIAIGFLLGMQLGAREARRIDIDGKRNFERFIQDLTFWVLVSSMAGARLLFVLVEWKNDYANDPLKIFRIWEGGFVFYGGFLAAVAFSIIYARRKKWSFLLVSDVLIPSVALGHFFGRIGCFAAGCCWGQATGPDFPLAVQFPAGSLIYNAMLRERVIAASSAFTIHVHPVQLYESFGELLLFFVLIFVRTKKRFHGQVLLTYLFIYPILRTSLEFIRGDKARGENVLLGLSTSQLISVFVALCAVGLLTTLIVRRSRSPSPMTEATTKAAST